MINLFWRVDPRPEAKVVLQVIREKCGFKGMPVPDFASLQPFREEMEGDWDAMLGHQLPAIPPIKSFWAALPGFFTWLQKGVASPAPVRMPVAMEEDVVSSSSRGLDLALRGAADLERIRFAAANRLCVDLRYGGVLRRLEPYSLRRTREGDVALYAYDVGSSETQRYRTREVEITSQSFVPRHANELTPPER